MENSIENIYIIVDTREHALYDEFLLLSENSLLNTNIIVERQQLLIGDILIKYKSEIFTIIERKTISDLLSSIKDGRYKEQSYRLIHSSNVVTHNIMYLIEGIISSNESNLVYSTITSLIYYKGFNVMRTTTIQETALFIYQMANKFKLNFDDGKLLISIKNEPIKEEYINHIKQNKKDNITIDNINQIMLSQIPYVSPMISTLILNKYKTLKNVIDEVNKNPKCLEDITYITGKKRKISKNALSNIVTYLCEEKKNS